MEGRIRKLVIFTLAIIFGLSLFAGQFSVSKIAATNNFQFIVSASSPTAGGPSNYDIQLRKFVNADLTTNRKIVIQFPQGFDLRGQGGSLDYTDIDIVDDGVSLELSNEPSETALGVTVAANSITIISGGVTISGTSSIIIRLGTNAVDGNDGDQQPLNPSSVSSDYRVTGTLRDASDQQISVPFRSLAFSILAESTVSNMDGLYYLSDDLTTHYQVAGGNIGGTWYDVGSLNPNSPTEKEFTYCGYWVQYYFDKQGFFQNTNIDNIYYHVWWSSLSNSGNFGYFTDGAYGSEMVDSFQADSATSDSRVDNFNLLTYKQDLDEEIAGNAVYNFGITFDSAAAFPAIRNNPDQASFIIINLPDNATLESRDSDGDNLNDYTELFETYTNPEDSDSDNDGVDDQTEYLRGSNPNETNKAPSFNEVKTIQKFVGQDEGGTLSGWSDHADYFGTNVSSISDLDGDGKDDIVISAPHANSDGFYDNGAVNIFSSKDYSLLKRIRGPADMNHLGLALEIIGDQDGDGYDDLIIGRSPSEVVIASSSLTKTSEQSILKVMTVGANVFNSDDNIGRLYPIENIDGTDSSGITREDIVVGAINYNDMDGAVYLLSSDPAKTSEQSILKTITGASNEALGQSISTIDDMDGDGIRDIITNALNYKVGDTYFGKVVILSSNPNKTTFEASLVKTFDGSGDYSLLGQSLTYINDRDGDLRQDFVAGAYRYLPDGEGELSSIYVGLVYSSATGEIIQELTGDVATNYGTIDFAKMTAKDGSEDILMGTVGVNRAYSGKYGIVRQYTSDGTLRRLYPAEMPGDYFAAAISSIGDQNGDGIADILIGASGYSEEGKASIGAAYLISTEENKIPDVVLDRSLRRSQVISLDGSFTDPNSNSLPCLDNLIISIEKNTNVIVNVDQDARLATFIAPDEWSGVETMRFIATDSYGLTAYSNSFNVEVAPTLEEVISSSAPATVQNLKSKSMRYSYTSTSDNSENDPGVTGNDDENVIDLKASSDQTGDSISSSSKKRSNQAVFLILGSAGILSIFGFCLYRFRFRS